MKQTNRSISKNNSKITSVEKGRQIYGWWITELLCLFLVGVTMTVLGLIDSYTYRPGFEVSLAKKNCISYAFGAYAIFTFFSICAAMSIKGWKRKLLFILFSLIGLYLSAVFSTLMKAASGSWWGV